MSSDAILYTICLLSSSVTVHLAGKGLHETNGDIPGWWLTIAPGATFMRDRRNGTG
jgi:heme/copper-type cytochrome/quinol oxidase subunit 3